MVEDARPGRAGRVQLIAVQAEIGIEDYRSPETFRAMIARHMDAVMAVRMPDMPALVAFPEAVGLPLLFGLRFHELTASASTVAGAAGRILRRHWPELLRLVGRHRSIGPHLLYLLQWRAVYAAYMDAFRAAAREARVHLIAGSLYLPLVDEEATRGTYLESVRARNLSYVFNPQGRVIGRVAKVHFVSAEKHACVMAGRVDELQPITTAVGRVGVAICLDAFHDGVLRHYDQMGTELLVQPSANDAAWLAPWEFDESVTQEEQWWAEGLPNALTGRESLRYGVNPMLVGRIFDMAFEGRSTICANPDFVRGPWAERDGILAVADDPATAGVVTAEARF